MGKLRQRRRRVEKRIAHQQGARLRRRERESAAAAEAEIQRAKARNHAQAKLARAELYGNLNQRQVNRLHKLVDVLMGVCVFVLAPFVAALVLRSVFGFEVVRIAAVIGGGVGLFAAATIAVLSLFIYRLTLPEMLGQWLFEAAVGMALVTYAIWPHVWLGAIVLVATFAAGLALALWGIKYHDRLRELAS